MDKLFRTIGNNLKKISKPQRQKELVKRAADTANAVGKKVLGIDSVKILVPKTLKRYKPDEDDNDRPGEVNEAFISKSAVNTRTADQVQQLEHQQPGPSSGSAATSCFTSGSSSSFSSSSYDASYGGDASQHHGSDARQPHGSNGFQRTDSSSEELHRAEAMGRHGRDEQFSRAKARRLVEKMKKPILDANGTDYVQNYVQNLMEEAHQEQNYASLKNSLEASILARTFGMGSTSGAVSALNAVEKRLYYDIVTIVYSFFRSGCQTLDGFDLIGHHIRAVHHPIGSYHSTTGLRTEWGQKNIEAIEFAVDNILDNHPGFACPNPEVAARVDDDSSFCEEGFLVRRRNSSKVFVPGFERLFARQVCVAVLRTIVDLFSSDTRLDLRMLGHKFEWHPVPLSKDEIDEDLQNVDKRRKNRAAHSLSDTSHDAANEYFSSVNHEAIEIFADEFLRMRETSGDVPFWMPDDFLKEIYEFLFRLSICVLEEALLNSRLRLLGSRVRFSLIESVALDSVVSEKAAGNVRGPGPPTQKAPPSETWNASLGDRQKENAIVRTSSDGIIQAALDDIYRPAAEPATRKWMKGNGDQQREIDGDDRFQSTTTSEDLLARRQQLLDELKSINKELLRLTEN